MSRIKALRLLTLSGEIIRSSRSMLKLLLMVKVMREAELEAMTLVLEEVAKAVVLLEVAKAVLQLEEAKVALLLEDDEKESFYTSLRIFTNFKKKFYLL